MLNFNEYKIMVKAEQEDKEFKPTPFGNYYIYRGFIVDYNYDYSDCVSDDFDPFYQKGYTRLIGNDKVDYVHNALILNYKNDIQKYKLDIINFIDRKIEKHKKN